MLINLLIVDDCDLIRASLRALLGSVADIATHMANTPGQVLGMVKLRGVIVPIVDMRTTDEKRTTQNPAG